MQHFAIRDLLAEQERIGQRYQEFLRVPSLSVGIYQLKAGQTDPQSPHTEDEVYYVLSGRAHFRSGDEVREVKTGTILFVERLLEHRFFDITEDLTVLVFFAPEEGSRKSPAT
jgi:mannose-6-phosphate isomerase-like protein (cupin superfamily)